MIRLTPAQQAALTWCLAYERTHGQPPSLAEIAAHLGTSRQYAQQVRVAIEIRLGLERRAYQPRPSLAVPREGVSTIPPKVNKEVADRPE